MTFITGENKIVNIGNVPGKGGANSLEMILREAGRFIIRGPNEFVALSEKKTRTINISGTIGVGSVAEHFVEYENNPGNVEFATAETFPQDLIDEYRVESLEVFGIAQILNLSISTEPGDAVCRLLGAHINQWISRQPLTSWNDEDCVRTIFSAYQTLPENGISGITEGILINTSKKKLMPIFSPIKSSFSVRKLIDKIYVYTNVAVLGYCAASTAGGSLAGSAVFDERLIIGKGFLPEEVEELLSPSQ